MCTEIEAKLKVDSLPQIEQKLTELGAEFLAEELQRDYYFDNAGSSFRNSDQALRLRRQVTAGRQKNLLTYKGPQPMNIMTGGGRIMTFFLSRWTSATLSEKIGCTIIARSKIKRNSITEIACRM